MAEWIGNNYAMLSLAANFGMLAIWALYLQVFLRGYRRNTSAKIVISRAGGPSPDARCFVGNMSSEAIYIESVIAAVEIEGQRWECAVTDVLAIDGEEHPTETAITTQQGPLKPGEHTDIGSFNDLLRRAIAGTDGVLHDTFFRQPATARITVIADYASEDLLIGAERIFDAASRNGRWDLRAQTVETHQIRSRRERQAIQNLLKEHL